MGRVAGVVRALLTVVFLLAAAPLLAADYTDPASYPANWPADAAWVAYTYNADILNDITGNPDPSRGTSLSNVVDVSSGWSVEGVYPSTFIYGDGNNLFFRFRVHGPPYSGTGGSQPFTPATWTTLMDINGDGWWDFALQVMAKDSTDVVPNDLEVYYNKSHTDQSIGANVVRLWSQDCAKAPSDAVDGETGAAASWDVDPDTMIWDFQRSRIVQLDRTKPPSNNNSEYYIDYQIPIAVLDASGVLNDYGVYGPKLNTSSWFSYGFSTANSATDPFQKDYVYEACITPSVTSQAPFGDAVNPLGQINQKPILPTEIIVTPNTTTCTATADLLVLDTHQVTGACGGAQTVQATLASVYLYYALDVNGNGLPDDGMPWILMSPTPATPVSGPGPYRVPDFDLSALGKGMLVVKGVATDITGNVTDSADTNPASPAYNPATYNATTGLYTPIVGTFDNTACGAVSHNITGYIFLDADADGVRDAGEGGLGVPAYAKLLDGTGTLIQMVAADESTGAYGFTFVVDGDYTIIEDDNNDQADTTPGDPAGFISTTPNTISVTVSGADVTGQDFGDTNGYTVSGYVYADGNHNKAMDGAEDGLVTGQAYVKLVQGGSVLSVSVADMATGYYELPGVLDGDYTLIEDDNNTAADSAPGDPAGWVSTTSNTLALTVSGGPVAGMNFGDFKGSVMSGYVFDDSGDGSAGSTDANNAVKDGTESGVKGVLVQACADSSCLSQLDSAYSDSTGAYTVYIPATVADGSTVYITEEDLNGYLSTGNSILAAVQNDPSNTSDDRNTLTYTMTSGQAQSQYNFGDVRVLTIAPDQSYMVSVGGSVTIRHIINVWTPGKVGILLASTNAWGYAVYDDSGCDETADGGAITPTGGYYMLDSGNVLAAGTYCVVLATVAPSNSTSGTVEKLVVMASEDWNNTSGVNPDTGGAHDDVDPMANDTITASAGGGGMLRLEKWVRNVTLAGTFVKKNNAEPCHSLEYRVNFKNIGSMPLKSVVLSDIVPDGTSLVQDVYSGNTKDVSVDLQGSGYYGAVNDSPDTDGVTLSDNALTIDLFKLIGSVTELESGEEGYFMYTVGLDCP